MLKLITQSSDLPVSLTDIKAHLVIEHTADDTRLTALAWAAVLYIEKETNRSFTANTYDLILSGFADRIYLPMPPLASITSVTYYDTDNQLQTLDSADYYLITGRWRQAYIEPVTSYPATYSRPDAVTVRFVTGAANDEMFKLAVKLLVGHWNENREGQDVPHGFDRILNCLTNWREVI
ncbi:hypothetical protein GC163_13245 [bacterium]|nr:hypothetical protein [bacterium]